MRPEGVSHSLRPLEPRLLFRPHSAILHVIHDIYTLQFYPRLMRKGCIATSLLANLLQVELASLETCSTNGQDVDVAERVTEDRFRAPFARKLMFAH